VSVQWNGVNPVFCDLWDAEGKQKLTWWECRPGMTAAHDAAPGVYQIRLVFFGGAPKPGYPPYLVVVRAGAVTSITPEVGEVVFRWNGAKTGYCDLWDLQGKKKLTWWGCQPGKSVTQDVAPGDYQVRMVQFGGAPQPGYQPQRITVMAGKSIIVP
jgi:hypothetical protein